MRAGQKADVLSGDDMRNQDRDPTIVSVVALPNDDMKDSCPEKEKYQSWRDTNWNLT